jgi:SET domain-containing protein
MVMKTPDMGWGLYAAEDILKDDFVVTYIGEYITEREAEKREKGEYHKNTVGSYFFQTKDADGAPSIDATR